MGLILSTKEELKIQEVVYTWDIENFITKICLFCEYCVQENGEHEFINHLLKEHKEEIKKHFNL